MVSISRELAARRAETASALQKNIRPLLLVAAIGLGLWSIASNSIVFGEITLPSEFALFFLQQGLGARAEDNKTRAEELRNDSSKVKEYRSLLHRTTHNVYRKFRGWS